MKLLNLYTLSCFIPSVRTKLLPTKKICRDCRHFIANDRECGKFGDTNFVTGKVTHPYASTVRDNDKQCGKDAILFEENHFKLITVPYYFFKDHFIFIPLFGLTGFYISAFIHLANR